jgi:hypothetical protein
MMKRPSMLGPGALALLMLTPCAYAADIDGQWDMVFQVESGPRTMSLSVTTDGASVTATLDEAELTGTHADGAFELSGEYYAADAGYSATVTLEGRLEDGELRGDWAWSEYGSVFVGTRHQEPGPSADDIKAE